tara:strand:+ start:216 stop:440 length:225 start_codon:yes stop_codon:yes gene_type:complete
MSSVNEIESMIQGINQQITEIISDIKLNTNKKNKQNTKENKAKLREISKKLRMIKSKLTDVYSPKTRQTTLNIE